MSVHHFRRASPQQQRPTYARGAPSSATKASAESQPNDADYARAVLAQYRKHVATTLEPELERLKIENAELRYDAEIAADQLRDLKRRLHDATDENETFKQQLKQVRSNAELEVRRSREHADDRVAAAQQAARIEAERAHAQLARAEETLRAMRDAGYDPNVKEMLSNAVRSLEDVRAERDAALKKCTQLQQELITMEERQKGALLMTPALSSELRSLATESAEFAGGLVSALNLVNCDCTEFEAAVAQWRSVITSSSADTTHTDSQTDHHRRSDFDSLLFLTTQCRECVRQEHVGLAAALKRMVFRNSESLESASVIDRQLQEERDLARRRLTELEEDRRAERESLLVELEKERVRNRLLAVSNNTAADTKRIVATRVAAAAGVASQTGPELLDARSEREHVTRLISEIVSLQNDVLQLREVVKLLEEQRRLFMDFTLHDDLLTSRVAAALQGDFGQPSSEEFFMGGV